MKEIKRLEKKRKALYEKIAALGDFRPGTVSQSYRRCGKKNCVCAREGHPGHVQYLWTFKVQGKSVSRTLHPGPELWKFMEETDRYREFKRLCKELIEVNEQLCDLRPVPVITDEQELDNLKKKLRERFRRRSRKK